MNSSVLSLLTLLLWSCFFTATGEALDYGNLSSWEGACNAGGIRQSPIDLHATSVRQVQQQPITFLNYDKYTKKVIVVRKDNSVQLQGEWRGDRPSITGPLLKNQTYIFVQGHMHWSRRSDDGTEHSINGTKYATELHLVHYNSKYANATEAGKHKDGLAVVGILYKEKNLAFSNTGMKHLAKLIGTVLTFNLKETSIKSLKLGAFLPKPVKSFYNYKGSLTTPPCTENVNWIVMGEPQPINSLIMGALRVVAFKHRNYHNARPVQPTNNRAVKLYTL